MIGKGEGVDLKSRNDQFVGTRSILVTKLQIPVNQANILPRPHLHNLLNHALDKNVIMVGAPAGFGKTTLVSEWVKTIQLPVAWVSIGLEDNEPETFLEYMLSALAIIDDKLGLKSRNLLYSPNPPVLEKIFQSCINEIAMFSSELCLVIDNFHMMNHPQIQQIFAYLLEFIPSNLKIILITKTENLPGLKRLKYTGKMVKISKEELRFKGIEFKQFYHILKKLPLNELELQLLENKTEGWVISMNLFAQALAEDRSMLYEKDQFSGRHPYIYSYLIEEMFDYLDDSVRNFLLEVSILDELSCSLCEAVTLKKDAAEYLQLLFSSKEMIKLIPERNNQWFRLHSLLREFFYHQLDNKYQGNLVHLHRRAYTWYYTQGYISKAVNHAVQAKDLDKATEYLWNLAPSLLKNREYNELAYLLNLFPNDWIENSPHLCIIYSWTLALQKMWENAHAYLAFVDRLILKMEASLYEKFLIELHVLRGYIALLEQKGDECIKHMTTAAKMLPKYSEFYHMGVEILSPEWNVLGSDIAFGGQLTSTCTLYGKLREIWKNSGLPIVGFGAVVLGEIYYEWDELDKVQYFSKRGMYIGKKHRNLGILVPSSLLYARMKRALNDVDEMWHVIQQLEDSITDRNWRTTITGFKIKILLEEGRVDKAVKLLEKLEQMPATGMNSINQIRVLRASGKWTKALKRIEPLIKQVELENRLAICIELMILQSLIHFEQGNRSKAFTIINQAIRLGMKEGYLRLFLDEGTTMKKLLCDFQKIVSTDQAVKEYCSKILSKFQHDSIDEVVVKTDLLYLDDLTNRELEVLKLLEKGLTNKEIAEALFITVGTVKLYNHKIYSKLQVKSRTQALIRAKELRLIDY